MKSTEANIVNNSQQLGRVCQRSALVSPKKTLDTDPASIGDDSEPIKAPREDVEMRNGEDEEPLEAEVPMARMNPKSPTCREKQEHEDLDMLFTDVDVVLVSKVVVLVDSNELSCWMKRREKERLQLLPSTTVS